MEVKIILVVYLAGLVAMFVELVLPGVVIGLIGFFAAVSSIIYAVTTGHMTLAVVLTVFMLAFLPLFFVLWKGVLARFLSTKGQETDFRPSTTIDRSLVGAEGVALSHLRPSGVAHLNGKRYDVITRGEMVERGTRIHVIEVSGNRIVVKRL